MCHHRPLPALPLSRLGVGLLLPYLSRLPPGAQGQGAPLDHRCTGCVAGGRRQHYTARATAGLGCPLIRRGCQPKPACPLPQHRQSARASQSAPRVAAMRSRSRGAPSTPASDGALRAHMTRLAVRSEGVETAHPPSHVLDHTAAPSADPCDLTTTGRRTRPRVCWRRPWLGTDALKPRAVPWGEAMRTPAGGGRSVARSGGFEGRGECRQARVVLAATEGPGAEEC